MSVYSKGTKDNLSKAERNDLRKALATMADNYRAGMRKRIRAV